MNSSAFPRLAGKVVLITGAWGGFGRQFAQQLLASNAKLILTDLREFPIETLAEGVTLPAGWQQNVLGQVVADLNDPDGARSLYEACKNIAPVDLIVHNAGLAALGYYEDIPLDKMNLQMRVMLTAPMEITHRFLPDFFQRGSGHFVFLDSVAGIVATPLGTSYSAAKFGLRGFAMALSGEIRNRGLDVTIVYPFFTRTAILKSPVYGNASIPPMPAIYIDDPNKVIHAALAGVNRRSLHVRPGLFSKFMWYAVRVWPLVVSQMQPKAL